MDTSFFVNFISEIAYLLIVLGVIFSISIFKGRQAIINIIFALYLALLISVEFPFYEQVLGSFSGAVSLSMAKLIIFLVFTGLAAALCFRIMPDEFREMNVYSMLTTTPNKLVKPIHPTRMPVILDPDDYEKWLTGSPDEATKLLRPFPPDQMRIALEDGNADEGGAT